MFNKEENENQSQLATMDDILGAEVGEVAIYQSNQWACGPYLFKLHAFETRSYEIKAEDHPDVGSEAPMLILRLVCLNLDDKAKYRDLKNKIVSQEEVKEKVGRAYTETVMFGNDHLIDDRTGGRRDSGARKFATLMSHIIGEKEYAAVKNLPRGEQLELAMANIFIAELRPDREKRNSQLDIINPFKILGTAEEYLEDIAPAINAYEEEQKKREENAE